MSEVTGKTAGTCCGSSGSDRDADADATGPGGQSVSMDETVKAGAVRRLRRIEGQIRGLQRMVEQERYCADIMTQIASVQAALRGVSKELMRNHLEHCAAKAIREGGDEADRIYDELLELMYRNQG